MTTPLIRARRKPHQFSLDELDYLRTYYPHKPTAEIAKVLGTTDRVVSNRARLMGLKKTQKHLRSQARQKYQE